MEIHFVKKIIAATIICLMIYSFQELKAQNTQPYSKNKIENFKNNGKVWIPDERNNKYKNPVIFADYSDPDVIRVGEYYYLTSSSFSNFPGLPVLRSKDLVNWKIVDHAVPEYPFKEFNKPRHGNGIWAPSIRFHNGEYYIYYGDPDNGIFMTKTKNPEGKWSPLVLVRKAKGWIDPCPLWDDDGNVYLVHAWAHSRSGIKSILTLNKLNKEGTKILDDGKMVFDGRETEPTIEGPKFYKRNGYYYIFAPAGGVKPGWQVVLRSKNVYGPYEVKKVLEQGNTNINGPHQGAWVETQNGQSWFIHFQDRYAYGRVVLLEPMKWINDWPEMGADIDKNGIGEPVTQYRKPYEGKNYPVEVPQTNDEFNSSKLDLQWQWEANPNTKNYSLTAHQGWLRLYSRTPASGYKNLWDLAGLLGQKIPAPKFKVTVKTKFNPEQHGETSGLVIYGEDYAYIGLEKTREGLKVIQNICTKSSKGNKEKEIASNNIKDGVVYLRVSIDTGAVCRFFYSTDGIKYIDLGTEFTAVAGRWVGARIDLFSFAPDSGRKTGYVDFDWIRFEK